MIVVVVAVIGAADRATVVAAFIIVTAEVNDLYALTWQDSRMNNACRPRLSKVDEI